MGGSTEEPDVKTEQLSLTLDPEELSYDDEAGTVTFSPGSRVRSARYTHYLLDLESLEAALGGRPESPVTVIVALQSEESGAYSPSDPTLPQPQGGFRIIRRTGRVLSPAP
jgi:hypothetical protein